MSESKKNGHAPEGRTARRTFLSKATIKQIAKLYDGQTHTIDALVKRYGLERHQVSRAARRGGYKTKRQRKSWTEAENTYLRDHWGRTPAEEIAETLRRTLLSVQLQKKRLGISTRDFDDWTIRDLEDLEHGLGIDHRLLHRFIGRGWLRAWEQPRCGAVPVTRVSIDNLHRFLTEHPEVVNPAKITRHARGLLELEKLPPPPKYKLLTCRSESWQDQMKPTPVGPKVHHGDVRLADKPHTFEFKACAAVGGTDFWAPLYEESPHCPRCGCKVSRFTEKAQYRDDDPGDADEINVRAGKLGLKWNGRAFVDASGTEIGEETLIRYCFSTKRNAARAFGVFRKLLQKGIRLMPTQPISTRLIKPNILSLELENDQREAWDAFLQSGGMSIDAACGWGKSTIGSYALVNIVAVDENTGEPLPNLVFTDTTTLREDWIRKLRARAPRIEVTKVYKPHFKVRVRVFDHEDRRRVDLHFYTYRTRNPFQEDAAGCVVYDEEARLVGNMAHRLAMIPCVAKLGMSAARERADDRHHLLEMMTGRLYKKDWRESRSEGRLRDVPVTALVVDAKEDKFAAAQSLVNGHKTVIFCDSLADGHRFSEELRVPFIHAGTKNRMELMSEHRVFVLSRVGDTGISIPKVERTVDAFFHHGSRAQSVQRYGRVLHGEHGEGHYVLLTRKELLLYRKRLVALEERGCRIKLRLYTGKRGRPSETTPKILGLNKASNRWLALTVTSYRQGLPTCRP